VYSYSCVPCETRYRERLPTFHKNITADADSLLMPNLQEEAMLNGSVHGAEVTPPPSEDAEQCALLTLLQPLLVHLSPASCPVHIPGEQSQLHLL